MFVISKQATKTCQNSRVNVGIIYVMQDLPHWNHRVAFHVSDYQTPLFTYFDAFLWCLFFSPWNKSKKMNSPVPFPPVQSGITGCPVLLFPQHLLMAIWIQGIGLWGLVGLNQCNCYDPDRCYFSTLIKFDLIVEIFLRKVARTSGGLTVSTLFHQVFDIVLTCSEKDVWSNVHIPIFHMSRKLMFVYQDSRGRLNWEALPWAGIKLYMGMPF